MQNQTNGKMEYFPVFETNPKYGISHECIQSEARENLIPPINADTLRELNYENLLNNEQLLHDLFFESDLKFRPNISIGRSQREEKYWCLVRQDIEAVQTFCRSPNNNNSSSKIDVTKLSKERGKGFLIRVPLMLIEIQKIMKEIMIPSEWEAVQDSFDNEIMMQQLEINAFGFIVSYFETIAALMKDICAPIRDPSIDAMMDKCRSGHFLEAFQAIFTILELMKMDVANHLLRKIKPIALICAGTNHFERLHKKQQLEEGLRLDKTLEWFKKSFEDTINSNNNCNDTNNNNLDYKKQTAEAALKRGIENLVLSLEGGASSSIPEIFDFDQTRLIRFKESLEDLALQASLLNIVKCILNNLYGKKEGKPAFDYFELRSILMMAMQESHIDEIFLSINLFIQNTIGRELLHSEQDFVTRLLQPLLTDKSKYPIYTLLEKKILSLAFTCNPVTVKEGLQSLSISEFNEEFECLSSKIRAFYEYQKSTFLECFYMKLLE